MFRLFFPIIFLLFTHISKSQSTDFGIMVGGSNYQGDLQEMYYEFSQMHFSFGGNVTHNFNENWSVRGEIWKGNLSGADANSRRAFALGRNLSFNSRLYEINLVGIYHFSNLQLGGITPYVFGGLAGFRINPYTYDTSGKRYHLFLLSTEGQGLAQYPEISEHRLFNISIPLGAGITWNLTPKLSLGLETGFRKTFTDYIDDVSGFYISKDDLLPARGPDAVKMAYRGDETPSGNQLYPVAGSPRGNPRAKDWYYNTIFRIQIKGFSELSTKQKIRRQMNCPQGW